MMKTIITRKPWYDYDEELWKIGLDRNWLISGDFSDDHTCFVDEKPPYIDGLSFIYRLRLTGKSNIHHFNTGDVFKTLKKKK